MAKRYPERVNVAVPAGWLARIEAAAGRDDRSPADWVRGVLRRALAAELKRARRRSRREVAAGVGS